MFDDEKIALIETMPDSDTLVVLWVKLICLAGKVNDGGMIYLGERMPYSPEQLAAVLRRPLNSVRLALETFQKLEMIEVGADGRIVLTNWEKHQNVEGMERIREQTRKRVDRFRQRQPFLLDINNKSEQNQNKSRTKVEQNGPNLNNYAQTEENVTLRNVTVTQQNKNRIDQIRKEEDVTLHTNEITDRETLIVNFATLKLCIPPELIPTRADCEYNLTRKDILKRRREQYEQMLDFYKILDADPAVLLKANVNDVSARG